MTFALSMKQLEPFISFCDMAFFGFDENPDNLKLDW
jgi:hypothetical protein